MKMRRQLYRSGIVAMIAALSACSSETWSDAETVPGDSPILLTGAMTRADGNTGNTLQGYTNLYLSAKPAESSSATDYFTNVPLTVGDAVTGGTGAYYLETNAYYPLGGKEINLFAHTGQLKNGNLELEAGTGSKNDYLISNGTDGTGTKVSSNTNGTDSRAKELEFRHVMTKVEVVVKTTDISSNRPTVTPSNIEIKFNNSVEVCKKGTYALTTSSTADATSNKATATTTSGLYTLKQGVNYLVPTGETLSGKEGILSHLKIDDYIATPDDLNKLKIPQADNGGTSSNLVLSPGLSYKLTFEIERLKITAVTLTMQDWDIKTGNGKWDYDPHKVKVNMAENGGYDNSEEQLITKIVLQYTPSSSNTPTYRYIGSCEKEANGDNVYAKFLTLPTDLTTGTLKADLYTKYGLLIAGHRISYNVDGNGKAFSISLGANGMAKDQNNCYEVTTPLQFYYLMKNPTADTYKLTENIDISNSPLAIAQCSEFPEGATLDGNGKSILHLTMEGSGLFKTNKGTLKNIHLAFSSIDATQSGDSHVGALCSVNNGTIEGCINEANIKAKDGQTVGGICGKSAKTILACLNTGNIPSGAKVGGICGENASGSADAIKACINAGMLHGSSNHEQVKQVITGGICGYQSAPSSGVVINSCYWLTGTASHNQEYNDEAAIGSFATDSHGSHCVNTTNMTETELRTKAVEKLNEALTEFSGWEFKYEKDLVTNTYKTVWPIPVRKTNP